MNIRLAAAISVTVLGGWLLGVRPVTTAPRAAATVTMIEPEGEAQQYWPRWRGPSGQGIAAGERVSRHLVRDRERDVEGPGARPRQLVANRLA